MRPARAPTGNGIPTWIDSGEHCATGALTHTQNPDSHQNDRDIVAPAVPVGEIDQIGGGLLQIGALLRHVCRARPA